jgi:hypothetical protein
VEDMSQISSDDGYFGSQRIYFFITTKKPNKERPVGLEPVSVRGGGGGIRGGDTGEWQFNAALLCQIIWHRSQIAQDPFPYPDVTGRNPDTHNRRLYSDIPLRN